MRKGIIFFMLMLITMTGVQVPEVSSHKDEETEMIPEEAIRLRILAHSDAETDQEIKLAVRDEVNAYISEKVQYIDDIKVGRMVIKESVPDIEEIVIQTLEANGLDDQTAHVEYGSNISFPLKQYGNYVYPAGEYEAVLITIGEGKGANWWCVLFPPLCFLDFSNETEGEEADEEEIEKDEDEETLSEGEEELAVKFLLFEWLGLS